MFAIVHNHSRFLVLHTSTLLLLTLFFVAPTFAGETRASKIAEAVPAQIPEMITGGKWRKGNIGGYYRAMVVMPETKPSAQKKGAAEVIIQWIGKEDGASHSKIMKTVTIKEVLKQELQHAFLSMDTLVDNEMTLQISSFDAKKNKDISISFKATLPGKYKSK